MNNRVFWGAIALAAAAMLAAASIGDAARRLPNIDGVLVAGYDGTAQQILNVDDSGNVQTETGGLVADNGVASGNPVPVAGNYNSTLPTYASGDVGTLQIGSRGALHVTLCSDTNTSCNDSAGSNGSDGTSGTTSIRTHDQGYYFNGSTWDRKRAVVNATDSTGTGIAAAGILAQGDDTAPTAITENQFGNLRLDKTNRSLLIGQYNGTTAEVKYGNTDITVLASAARTTTTASSDLTNYNGRGIHLVIEVTAASATPSVVCTIQGKDALGGAYYTILASAAITGISSNVYRVFPAATAAANSVANDIMPRTWRVNCVHADSDSITYSIGSSVIL